MNNTKTNTEIKSLLDLLKEDSNCFAINEKDVIKYNAYDHPNYLKGKTATGKAAVVYSVYAINVKEDIAFTQNINAWGRCIEEAVPLSELVPNN